MNKEITEQDLVHSAAPQNGEDFRDGRASSEAATSAALGTFACPICGVDNPHHHPDEQVAAYRDDQVRRDGWISVLHRLPREYFPKFYLIRGHRIEVPKDDWSNVSYNAFQRRSEGPGYPAEVAEWDLARRSFLLLHWSGNARRSGEEGRSPVYVRPTHWRGTPEFGTPNDGEYATLQIAGLMALVKDQRDRLQSLRINTEHERERLVRELGEARSVWEAHGLNGSPASTVSSQMNESKEPGNVS